MSFTNTQLGRGVVLGASGFIGMRLVRRLAHKRRSVVAVDIAPTREQLAGVEYVTADVRQPLDAQIGTDAQILYNLAAVHRTPGHPAHEHYETNVLEAGRFTAVAKAGPIALIVCARSISVDGPTEEVRTEASPPSHPSDYGRSVLMAELIRQIWMKAEPSRLLVTVRLGVVVRPVGRGSCSALANTLRRGFALLSGTQGRGEERQACG